MFTSLLKRFKKDSIKYYYYVLDIYYSTGEVVNADGISDTEFDVLQHKRYWFDRNSRVINVIVKGCMEISKESYEGIKSLMVESNRRNVENTSLLTEDVLKSFDPSDFSN